MHDIGIFSFIFGLTINALSRLVESVGLLIKSKYTVEHTMINHD